MTGPERFITLEGGEGTGKSTLIAGLQRVLSERGAEIVVTREPGGTVLAEAVRALALNPPDDESWSPLAHALLMNTAREDHLKNLIRPALARGAWVICDRFADSTRAYQSIDGVALEQLLAIEAIVVGETRPDLTLILDAAPDALAERRRQRNVSDVFEQKDLSFHEQVRVAFLDIADNEPDRCVVLDALQSPEDVLNAALSAIDQHLVAA
ncbi:MAG: dTMP kinase [Henriciella sp.]|nr:dTMP kinase [Henriciella sp.]